MFVCVELTEPVEGQVQTCLVWGEQAHLLPPLTLEQGGEISVAMLVVLACAWGYAALGKLFDNDN